MEEKGEDKAMFNWEEEGGPSWLMDRKRRETGERNYRNKKRGSKKKRMKAKRNKVNMQRGEQKFTHCEYVDLSEIGQRDDTSGCHEGSKFLFKPAPGHRRQFLILEGSNIAVFLKHKHKVENCIQGEGLIDATGRAKCKDVNGARDIKIESAMGTCRSSCKQTNATTNTTATNTTTTTTTVAPTLGSNTTVFCPCPEIRNFICSTKVESNGNTHKVTCNKQAEVTVSCGSNLIGAKTVLGITLDYYKHALCTTKDYTSILVGYTWRCGDRNVTVPISSYCPGDVTTTVATNTTAASGK